MFKMCASNSHSYTHLKLALGIVREPTGWVLNFITSKYPGTHDIGLPRYSCDTTEEASFVARFAPRIIQCHDNKDVGLGRFH